ncbi:BamA/TamA family outer membrane protein [Rufibacter sediminis]|uniref:BamA/TamA family outer membrane protein n=1 Tax=Rufibacter sediminis TaxID=2762756 RepID=A0ABR6VSZ0_9BACT|nr:BamA/TamA family outer membrane protein [Rufibacter sediminis]MBC3539706.1 BamA/TamA family outer membrane protein [Rufibacter sediminis]
MKTKLLFLLLLAIPFASFAQTPEETPQDSVAPAYRKWNIYPVLYYTPETQFGFGTKLVHVRKSEGTLPTDRPDLYSPTLVYTSRKQILTTLSADVWRKHNRQHLYAQAEYNDYPYFFFGIGNNSPDEAEEAYTSRTFNFFGQFEQAVYKKVYLGARYEFKKETIPEVEPEGQLSQKSIIGSDGVIASGFGPVLMVDSRNNAYTPSKGVYHQFTALFFGKYLGGEDNFTRYKLDLRKYMSGIGPGVLAVQGLFTFVVGDAPFQYLSPLGGVNVMRGFLEGRFRDEDAVVIQADYRFPIKGRIGGALFGGAGQVSKRIQDFAADEFHLGGGAGLRYKLNKEGMVVRGDVAFSEQGMFLYFSFAEAF